MARTTAPPKALTPEVKAEVQRMAEEVMDVVATVAGRRLALTLEFAHSDMIKPLRDLLKEAKEQVRHAPECDGLLFGDKRCDCGAVEYLNRVEAATSGTKPAQRTKGDED